LKTFFFYNLGLALAKLRFRLRQQLECNFSYSSYNSRQHQRNHILSREIALKVQEQKPNDITT